MSTSKRDPASDDDKTDVLEVTALPALFAARDEADAHGEDVALKKKAIKDAAKAKGWRVDVFELLVKLRNKDNILEARDFMEQLNLGAQAIGIFDQGDLLRDVQPDEPRVMN
jgi:hypothetical protein